MAAAALPSSVLERLFAGAPVLVLSASRHGDPHSTYSWAVAIGPTALRVAVDAGGTTSANLRRNGRGAVQFVGASGLNLLVGGRLVLLADRLGASDAPALEVWELRVRRVLDQSWPGVATSALRYRWPSAEAAAMRRHERTVYAGLRDARTARPRRTPGA